MGTAGTPLLFLHWSFRALAARVWPDRRHDMTAFNETDSKRAGMGVGAMYRGQVLLQRKADWPEVCERFGFPTWTSVMRPCFACLGAGWRLFSTLGVTLNAPPCRPNTDDDYWDACARCELLVTSRRNNIGGSSL